LEPSTFRRDPYLRSSAYHLATWSLAAFVIEFQLASASGLDAANGIAALVVLIGASALSSVTHERRVGKMMGPAGAPVWAGAGQMWLVLLVGLAAGSLVLALGSLAALLFPLWALAVGAGFATWGRKAAFAWYTGLGFALVGVGLLDLAIGISAGPTTPFRITVLGLGLPGFALLTNRRFLWLRPPA
jgi:hypothetical protein